MPTLTVLSTRSQFAHALHIACALVFVCVLVACSKRPRPSAATRPRDASARVLTRDAGPTTATAAPVRDAGAEDAAAPPLPLAASAEVLARARRAAAAVGPHPANGRAVGEWLGSLSTLSKLGAPVIVRIPLVQRSQGWGCECPSDEYVGTDALGHGGGATWLQAQGPLPRSGRDGRISIVEGIVGDRFSWTHPDSEEMVENGFEFLVVRVVRASAGEVREGDARGVSVAVPGEHACRTYTHDYDPPTRIRAESNTRSAVVGELADGSEIRPVRVLRRFLEIDLPSPGFVYEPLTRTYCQ